MTYHVDIFVIGDDWFGKFDFLKSIVKSNTSRELKVFLVLKLKLI